MFREIVGWKQTLPLHLLLLVLLYLNICLFQMHCGSSSWLETGGAWGASSVFFFLWFPSHKSSRILWPNAPKTNKRTASKQSLEVVDLIHVLPPAVRSSPGSFNGFPLTKGIKKALKRWRLSIYFHRFRCIFFKVREVQWFWAVWVGKYTKSSVSYPLVN